jgi:phage head maturation protease
MTPLARLTQDLQAGIRFDMDRQHARVAAAGPAKIRGYGALFNTLFHPNGRSGTRALILPGAINLAGTDLLFCRGHDIRRPYASIGAGTLRAWSDDRGLAIEATPERSRSGEDLLRAIADNSEAGLSLGFLGAGRISAFEIVRGERVEVIAKTRVSEVSAVRSPLCPGASCWLVK